MNRPTIAFRTDASLDIGSGHVMRCLSLADALHERGGRCCFVCRAHPGNLLDLVREHGHEAHALPVDEVQIGGNDTQGEPLPLHASWLGVNWVTDALQTLDALGDTQVDWLIVDHYALDARWERDLRTACRRLMIIDDLADRQHECDVLLDQNLGRTTADYTDLVSTGCTILVGPKYALLRPEFAALRSYSLARRVSPQLKHLLITMGGVDMVNATSKVLDALRGCLLPGDFRITVVMGPHALWLEQVRDCASQMPWPTEVLADVRDMAKLMAECDLAIGAAGSTSWERCCLGLPSMLVVLAENQQPIAKALELAGAAKAISVPTLTADIEKYLGQDNAISFTLARASARASILTDGEGAAILSQTLYAVMSG